MSNNGANYGKVVKKSEYGRILKEKTGNEVESFSYNNVDEKVCEQYIARCNLLKIKSILYKN